MSNFRLNLAYSALGQMFVFALTFAFFIIVSRVLGPTRFGEYTIAMLVPTLAGRFGHLGIDSANAFFISDSRYTAANIYSNSLVITFLMTFLVALFFAFFSNNFAISSSITSPLYALTILLTGLFIFRTLFQSALIGKNRLDLYSQFIVVDAALPLAGALLFVYLFDFQSVDLFLYMNLFSITTACLVLVLSIDWNGGFKPNQSLAIESMRYGWKSWLNNLANHALYKADVLIIGYLLDPRAVGIYAVGVLVIEKSWYFSNSISNAIYPLLRGQNLSDGASLACSAANLNLIIAVAGAVFASVFSAQIVGILFGAQFLDSAQVIIFLAPGIIFMAIPKILVSHLAAIDKLGIAVGVSTTAVVINVSLNLFLIPKYGLIGACFASSISYFYYLLVYLHKYSRLTGVPVCKFLSLDVYKTIRVLRRS